MAKLICICVVIGLMASAFIKGKIDAELEMLSFMNGNR